MTNGWIEHDSEECPVGRWTIVETVSKKGNQDSAPAGQMTWSYVQRYRPVIDKDDAHAAVALLECILPSLDYAAARMEDPGAEQAPDEVRALLNKIRGEG